MKVTIFGLSLSSSWGNGHATPYRAIVRALHRRGVSVSFYEKDVPYYAAHRDFSSCDYCTLRLYGSWDGVRQSAVEEARASDVVVVASYCPDGVRISNQILELDRPLRVFYDLDTPITLKGLAAGPLEYIQREQIRDFDLYLSFTGGTILFRLEQEYGARMARALYGCVDPDVYFRVPTQPAFDCSLSYVGTYAADRQAALEELFLEPAFQCRERRFFLAGSLYPADLQWPQNIARSRHVGSREHPALYSSSRATLNLTRRTMAESGYCPSGRFFEAAACGTPIFTDWWEGLDSFFDPEQELRVVRRSADVIFALDRPDVQLREMADRARRRTLEQHTGEQRAREFLGYCDEASRRKHSAVEAVA